MDSVKLRTALNITVSSTPDGVKAAVTAAEQYKVERAKTPSLPSLASLLLPATRFVLGRLEPDVDDDKVVQALTKQLELTAPPTTDVIVTLQSCIPPTGCHEQLVEVGLAQMTETMRTPDIKAGSAQDLALGEQFLATTPVFHLMGGCLAHLLAGETRANNPTGDLGLTHLITTLTSQTSASGAAFRVLLTAPPRLAPPTNAPAHLLLHDPSKWTPVMRAAATAPTAFAPLAPPGSAWLGGPPHRGGFRPGRGGRGGGSPARSTDLGGRTTGSDAHPPVRGGEPPSTPPRAETTHPPATAGDGPRRSPRLAAQPQQPQTRSGGDAPPVINARAVSTAAFAASGTPTAAGDAIPLTNPAGKDGVEISIAGLPTPFWGVRDSGLQDADGMMVVDVSILHQLAHVDVHPQNLGLTYVIQGAKPGWRDEASVYEVRDVRFRRPGATAWTPPRSLRLAVVHGWSTPLVHPDTVSA